MLAVGVPNWRGQLLAMQDTRPAIRYGRPEQTLGQGEISSGQRITHLGAADANAVQFDSLRRFDGKALHDAGLLQEIEIPCPVTAETEVVADFKVLHAEAVNQDGIDELTGAELAQALVECQAQDSVDPFGSQQLQLVTQPGQTRWRRVRGRKIPGAAARK